MEPLIKSRWDIVFVISDIVEGAHLHGTISRGTNSHTYIIKKKYGDEDMEVRNRKSKRKTNKQKNITNQNHMDIKSKIMLGATFSAYCICKKKMIKLKEILLLIQHEKDIAMGLKLEYIWCY